MSNPDFRVDPDRLQALAHRLRQISVRLNDVRGPRVGIDVSGSEDIANALDDFSRGWERSYQNITDDISEVAQFLDTAARGYVTVEGELARTFDSGVYGSGGRGPSSR